MSTANKLTYLNGTKQAIKQAINEDFEVIDNNTTFREYADEISSNNAKYKDLIPKETKNATNTLDISNSSGLDKALVTLYGNTYQEGEPTPDAPQEIQVVTGDNSINVHGKNIFDGILELGSYSNSSGEKVNNIKIYRNANIIQVKPNTTYTFSINGTKQKYVLLTYGLTQNFKQQILNDTGTFTTASDVYYINFRSYQSDFTSDYANLEVQLEESQTYPINIGNIELCKISTYKDRIYPLNGKWYLEKNIGKVVLDGTEDWYINSNVFNIRNINNYMNTDRKTISTISNYYRAVANVNVSAEAYDRGNNTICLYYQNTTPRIFIRNDNYTTTSDFKTWLSTHNTIVYYVLATPTTTEITENNYPTLYNQLNNIKLFEGVNHITMTNESGLDVEFDITYYKDWKLD